MNAIAYDLVAGDPTLAGLVGRRVYQKYAPQGVKGDYVVFQKVSHARGHTFDGATDVESPVFQFTAVSTDANRAERMARAIVDAAERDARADVLGAFATSLSDDYEAAPDGSEDHVHVARVEVTFAVVTA